MFFESDFDLYISYYSLGMKGGKYRCCLICRLRLHTKVNVLWWSAAYHATFSKWTRLSHNHNHSITKPKNTPSYNKTIAKSIANLKIKN